MGARGPLKIVGGTDAPKAGSVAEEVQPEPPAIPAWVAKDPDVKQLWEETVAGLDAAGLLCRADALTVEAICRHTIIGRMAFEEVRRTGTVVVPASDEGVEKKHPAEAILRLETAALLELLKQSGMTWMSRARTPAQGSGKDTGANPFGAVAAGE